MPADKSTDQLKLFVWDKVLEDYSAGLAFALATSVTQARELILAAAGPFERDRLVDELRREPQIITSPKAFIQPGGA